MPGRIADQLEHEVSLAVNGRQTASANVDVITAQVSKLDADIARLQRQLQDLDKLQNVLVCFHLLLKRH